jgi:apolipoprotein D and lipocalin family protein
MKTSLQKIVKSTPFHLALGAAVVLLVVGCASSPPTITTAKQVDLQRFMGDWYVIGNIPTRPERNAFNAIESYTLRPDGRIDTHFRYREGAFDGELKTMNPTGRVEPGSGNAVWGMQFVWPIQAEYVIVDVDPAYQLTIIGRSKRDYAWIMARTPDIPQAAYDNAVMKLKALGYTTEGLRRVPQQWPEAAR